MVISETSEMQFVTLSNINYRNGIKKHCSSSDKVGNHHIDIFRQYPNKNCKMGLKIII